MRYGHYEFAVVEFGLKNAPIIFMCLMENALIHYLEKFIMVFVDGILVYFKLEKIMKNTW